MAKRNLIESIKESVKPHPLMRKKWFWTASLLLAAGAQISYDVQRQEINQLYKENSGKEQIGLYKQLDYLNHKGIFPESYMVRFDKFLHSGQIR